MMYFEATVNVNRPLSGGVSPNQDGKMMCYSDREGHFNMLGQFAHTSKRKHGLFKIIDSVLLCSDRMRLDGVDLLSQLYVLFF